MFEVSVSHKPSLFTASITIDDSCFTSDDIKDAFLEIAENNSIEDYESIDKNDIQIDYSDLPKWLSPGNLIYRETFQVIFTLIGNQLQETCCMITVNQTVTILEICN